MRAKQVIGLLCVVLLFAACRPDGVLGSRKMRNILYELHRADAILYVQGYNYGHDEQIAKYYQVVLDKNGVTKAEFDSSLVWYTNHPQLFNRMYPKILKRCQEERLQWDAIAQEEKPVVTVVRDLPPIEEVMDLMQHGYGTKLLPDSLKADSVDVNNRDVMPNVTMSGENTDRRDTHSVSTSGENAKESKPLTVPGEEMTPEEKARQERINRLKDKLKISSLSPQQN